MWAHKWKMIFNPDISKQTKEVNFSIKTNKIIHMPLTFNAILVAQTSHQKHLGLYLDKKLNLNPHRGWYYFIRKLYFTIYKI